MAMDLLNNVVQDIQQSFNIYPKSIQSINKNDIDLIGSVLKELQYPLSGNTNKFIQNRYLNNHNISNRRRNNQTYFTSTEVPETPILSKENLKLHCILQNNQNDRTINHDAEIGNDESFVYKIRTKTKHVDNIRNSNLSIFDFINQSFKDNSQQIDDIQMADTQMDIDNNEHYDLSLVFNDNDIVKTSHNKKDIHPNNTNQNNTFLSTLSESFCGLQLTQNKNEMNKCDGCDDNNIQPDFSNGVEFENMSLSPILTR